MEFITHKSPDESGSYIISVQISKKEITTVFNYIAFYDRSNGKWYKYDPFLDKELGEEIPIANINAWKETGGVFIK